MRRSCPDDFLIYVGASRAVAAARRLEPEEVRRALELSDEPDDLPGGGFDPYNNA